MLLGSDVDLECTEELYVIETEVIEEVAQTFTAFSNLLTDGGC